MAKAENGGGGDDDEVDPLDAFMAAEVLPEVHKLAVQAAQAVEDAAVAAAAAAREPSPAPGSDDMDVDGDAAAQVGRAGLCVWVCVCGLCATCRDGEDVANAIVSTVSTAAAVPPAEHCHTCMCLTTMPQTAIRKPHDAGQAGPRPPRSQQSPLAAARGGPLRPRQRQRGPGRGAAGRGRARRLGGSTQAARCVQAACGQQRRVQQRRQRRGQGLGRHG